MSKTFPKPNQKNKQPTAKEIDDFVNQGSGKDTETQNSLKTEKRKPLTGKAARLTIDLAPDEHVRFKIACAANRVKMVEEVRAFIEQRTAELEEQAGIARKAG